MRTIVIGAGAIGLSAAYYLRKSGADVTVVDAVQPGSKASSHNAGWVVPSMSTPVPAPGVLPQALRWMLRRDSPLYVQPNLSPQFIRFMLTMLRHCTTARFEAGLKVLADLGAETVQMFDDLRADGVRFESHADPFTMLFKDGRKLEHHAHELDAMKSVIPGFSWRALEGEALVRECPSVAAGLAGGLQTFGDRSLDPASFTNGLAAACTRDGVEFLLGKAASLRQETDGSASVVVGEKALRADRIVVAAGAWTNQVLAGIGERIALQAGKGYGYDLPLEDDGPTRPLYLAEAKVAITPLATKVRIAGTMGFGGINERIDVVRAGGLLSSLPSYFSRWPDLTRKPQPWTGLRPMTPDGLPIIGPLPRKPRVLVATGHAMLGISLAPPTGQLIAELATGQTSAASRASLAADRF
ncbi:FAD-dependent oxidoreductase [Arthrobacter sp. ISL-28]|uniref:FAD-dependent oxidoreductase n=1 Tax=Arthrobacter sp. ISL-28 TaxID=2819108 RepID=UPI001BEB7E4C|nr:FAD-dependent oxidoreductase [Arthrobacter sp. ISL-28]MBT2523082.1 FAD-dependent oxidoreductase [Arthrobacter sp. ISL-28]